MRPSKVKDSAAFEQLQRVDDIARQAQVSHRQVHCWVAAGELKVGSLQESDRCVRQR